MTHAIAPLTPAPAAGSGGLELYSAEHGISGVPQVPRIWGPGKAQNHPVTVPALWPLETLLRCVAPGLTAGFPAAMNIACRYAFSACKRVSIQSACFAARPCRAGIFRVILDSAVETGLFAWRLRSKSLMDIGDFTKMGIYITQVTTTSCGFKRAALSNI